MERVLSFEEAYFRVLNKIFSDRIVEYLSQGDYDLIHDDEEVGIRREYTGPGFEDDNIVEISEGLFNRWIKTFDETIWKVVRSEYLDPEKDRPCAIWVHRKCVCPAEKRMLKAFEDIRARKKARAVAEDK